MRCKNISPKDEFGKKTGSLIIFRLGYFFDVSLKKEFASLLKSLEENPMQGTPLGNNCFKVRLPIASKGKGKSGGARVITNFVITNAAVYLIAIYDKSEKDNLTDKELDELLKFVPE